ncbi:MAG: hypothetical protein ACRC5C_13215 [Bacilli bacterium]
MSKGNFILSIVSIDYYGASHQLFRFDSLEEAERFIESTKDERMNQFHFMYPEYHVSFTKEDTADGLSCHLRFENENHPDLLFHLIKI